MTSQLAHLDGSLFAVWAHFLHGCACFTQRSLACFYHVTLHPSLEVWCRLWCTHLFVASVSSWLLQHALKKGQVVSSCWETLCKAGVLMTKRGGKGIGQECYKASCFNCSTKCSSMAVEWCGQASPCFINTSLSHRLSTLYMSATLRVRKRLRIVSLDSSKRRSIARCIWWYNLGTHTCSTLKDASSCSRVTIGEICQQHKRQEDTQTRQDFHCQVCFSFTFLEWDVAVKQWKRVSDAVTLWLLSGWVNWGNLCVSHVLAFSHHVKCCKCLFSFCYFQVCCMRATVWSMIHP